MRVVVLLPHWASKPIGPLVRSLMTAAIAGVIAMVATGCSRLTDALNVPPPATIQTAAALKSQSGAEAVFFGARDQMIIAFAGSGNLLSLSGELSDEMTEDGASLVAYSGGYKPYIDARLTTGGAESGDYPVQGLLAARSSLLLAAPALHQYEPASAQQKAGEAYALAGYIEVLIAENYCAGVTLDRTLPNGGWEFTMPLTTDSLLATAEQHFDSAKAYANNDTTVIALANAGLARARLNRGRFAAAATAAAAVPTGFVYNIETPATNTGNSQPSTWAVPLPSVGAAATTNVADREGGNGLNFRSANDPRLVFDTTVGQTADRMWENTGGPWYYPIKFGNPATLIPLATGAEARLIEAEAALQAHNIPDWANRLNTLRAQAPLTYLKLASAMPPLSADSTLGANDTMQVSVMFRERAFWLFGLGTRLGDMRRLIRQYGRDQSTIYPKGPYGGGALSFLTTFGTDVSITLPTSRLGSKPSANPNYKGCIVPTTTA